MVLPVRASWYLRLPLLKSISPFWEESMKQLHSEMGLWKARCGLIILAVLPDKNLVRDIYVGSTGAL